MELKAVVGLTPGAVVAEDVYDHNGNVIIKKNTSLDKFLIQKLTIAKIACVNIKEPEDFLTTYFDQGQQDFQTFLRDILEELFRVQEVDG